MLKGIHVVLHPLLALTGDQVIRFQEGSNDYGMIEAINLDERGKIRSGGKGSSNKFQTCRRLQYLLCSFSPHHSF